eukprot:353126-Chlamydomonas_euryale.AAC.2
MDPYLASVSAPWSQRCKGRTTTPWVKTGACACAATSGYGVDGKCSECPTLTTPLTRQDALRTQPRPGAPDFTTTPRGAAVAHHAQPHAASTVV